MKISILDSKRTNNFTDPEIQTKIMSMWEKVDLGQEDLTIACIYREYQADYRGDYTVSLCKENSLEGIFDTSKYQWKEYIVDTNDKEGIINTWKKIWCDEDNYKIKRIYNFDFEQYKQNGEVSILVAVL